MKLSIALAVKNEEKNLDACLASIRDIADEIIIVDGGSTDKTIDIAKKFHAHIIITDNPPIFHINKQKALDTCKGEWILQLDADEVISEKLKAEIQEIISNFKCQMSNQVQISNDKKKGNNTINTFINRNENYAGYFIPRRNYFLGHWMRKGGQYPDYVIRLFQNGKGSFPCKSVHEQIVINGEIGYLDNPLDHYSYHSVSEYWKKARGYISLTAIELKKSDNTFHKALIFLLMKPLITFLSLFIRHKGFVDHIYGFLFALFSALHHPLAYVQYIRHKNI